MIQGYREFEFDLPKVLRAELIQDLEAMDTAPLTVATATDLPNVQGLYEIQYNGERVYIGKTNAKSGLAQRLKRHAEKTQQRPTLTGQLTFKAIRVMVFTAMELESQLLHHYRSLNKAALPWNGSGFGSNDPGRKRETTNQDPDGFDQQHPIDVRLLENWLPSGSMEMSKALARLRRKLPYTLRYQTKRDSNDRAQGHQPHSDMESKTVVIPVGPQTVEGLMRVFVKELGTDWQATAFPSHVILYKENVNYTHGQRIV